MSKLCKCITCCYFKTAVTEFAAHHAEAKSAGWCSGKKHCYPCGQGGFRRDVGDASSLPAIFKHVFDEYSFFIISNFFDNNKPSTLGTHNRNIRTKCIIFGETLRFRGKKFKQNLPKNCSKSAKMAPAVCQFLKFFLGSMPPGPPRAFFTLNMLYNNNST